MRRHMATLVWAVAMGAACYAFAELNIHRREDAAVVLDRSDYEARFNLDNALECLRKCREALVSFAELTENVRRDKLLPETELKRFGNTEWEMQNMGFPVSFQRVPQEEGPGRGRRPWPGSQKQCHQFLHYKCSRQWQRCIWRNPWGPAGGSCLVKSRNRRGARR